MNPRLRRLDADFRSIISAFSGHKFIKVDGLGPPPPEKYRVIYNLPGVRQLPDGQLVRLEQHVVDIHLPAGYPREKPYCVALGSVFHPNFGNHVCIADYWSPTQSLVDVIIQIGDMIQFKTFNTRSPLNARAALWASQNINALPIGSIELFPLEPEIKLKLDMGAGQ